MRVVADNGYQGAGPMVRVPQRRRRRLDSDTGRYRRLSGSQKQVNTAHARQRGPGERANAQLRCRAPGLAAGGVQPLRNACHRPARGGSGASCSRPSRSRARAASWSPHPSPSRSSWRHPS